MKKDLKEAIEKLAWDFTHTLDFTFHTYNENGRTYKANSWPGDPNEDVTICVYKGHRIHEPFHHHEFFFFNYAYHNKYGTQTDAKGTMTTINENECYIGQPYTGYALRATQADDVTIIGVLIQRDVFIRDYLPTLALDNKIFRFFLEPEKDYYSDQYMHLKLEKNSPIRTLLEMMVIEYANRKPDTQLILKPMVLTLFMMIARVYRAQAIAAAPISLTDQILQYMSEHISTASLKETAAHFSYNPNYISTLVHKETGKTYSKILLDMRMERALILLSHTDLPIEEIAYMLGYNNQSNFYKAFKEVYGQSPREFMKTKKDLS